MIARLRPVFSTLVQGIVFPFVETRWAARRENALLGALHALIVAAAAVGLWRLNQWLELDKAVHVPSRMVREWWLPLMFLLSHALVVTLVWTGRILARPMASSAFPEIDELWRQGRAALLRGDVTIKERPVVVVLGLRPGEETSTLAALGISPTAGPAPVHSPLGIRLLACERAVYLTCGDASLVTTLAERIARSRTVRSDLQLQRPLAERIDLLAPSLLRSTANEAGDHALDAAANLGAANLGTANLGATEATSSSADETANTLGVDEVRQLAAQSVFDDDGAIDDLAEQAADGRPADDSTFDAGLLRIAQETADAAQARMEYLLGILAEEMDLALPIEGVAVIAPADGLRDERTSAALAEAVRRDLDAIASVAGCRAPVATIVNDLEFLPGCSRLLDSLPADRKRRHLGVAWECDEGSATHVMEERVQWLSNQVVPALVRKLYSINDADRGPDSVEKNSQLFQFARQVRVRSRGLVNMLGQALTGAGDGRWPLAGCYFVATGDPQTGRQAFGYGALDALWRHVGRAVWSQPRLAHDARCAKMADFIVVGLFVVGALAGLGWLWGALS